MWRPAKWEETTFYLGFGTSYKCASKELGVFGDGVEASADAILEALLNDKNVILVSEDTLTLPGFMTEVEDYLRSLGEGTWVFIPKGQK